MPEGMPKPLILVVEDNKEIRLSARFVLEDMGYEVADVSGPEKAKAWLQEHRAALILLDMNFHRDTTSGEEGLNFLQWCQQQGQDSPIVAMTAWSNTDLVVKAIQYGAGDFVEKPWTNARLQQVVVQQLSVASLNRRNQGLSQQLASDSPELLWHSDVMQQLQAQLETVAATDANVLLRGENGTGKSMLAKWLHARSPRAQQPLISVNMGAIPEHLFESEMFGHRKGAFTDAKEKRIGRFELADGGTLFLDEIATIPPNQQSKLLRVLESKEFEMVGSSHTQSTDVRIISASNGDFEQLIDDDKFRRDLYFRLNTMEFVIPPLRERPEDIDMLAECFVTQHSKRYNKQGLQLVDSAKRILRAYAWPGNVRELSHMIERAVLLCHTNMIDTDLLNAACGALSKHQNVEIDSTARALDGDAFPMMTLESAELALIQQALTRHDGNKQQAADLLGITKSSLYRRLEKYDLTN